MRNSDIIINNIHTIAADCTSGRVMADDDCHCQAVSS